MRRLGLLLLLAGCGHIPKADPTGVPPPWPATPAPLHDAAPEIAPPPEAKPAHEEDKSVVPPLKQEILPQPPRT